MTFEKWLRERAAQVTAPVAPPDALQRIEHGISRRSRQRQIMIATAGLVALGGTGGLAFTLSAGEQAVAPAAQADVAWIATPGSTYSPDDADWRGWPACSAASTRVEAGRQGAWRGHASQQLTLVNEARDCVVRGAPSLLLRARTGDRPVDPAQFAQTPLPLRAGQKAMLLVGAPASCEPSPADTATSAELRLGAGQPVEVPGIRVPLTCGEPVTLGFELLQGETSTDPLAHVQATWRGPDSARGGEPLHYVIALHNPTGTDIPLTPCPSYTQKAGDLVTETFLLNCQGGVTHLRAGETKTFAMQLELPRTERGELKVGWHLEVQAGASAGAVVSIE